MEEGRKLLGLFREEQEKHSYRNYQGCTCDGCCKDMGNALNKYKDEIER
ncbi:hypothetical protein LCGC14_3100250 [marine sediment metagenome]|uniref:Uncharacterized protein n=1 Tax=marine sediment metagenome TaxID=412755 RepID=A0A0F8W8G7_9ZZZZ